MPPVPTWPPSHRYLTDAEIDTLASRCKPRFEAYCRKSRIDTDLSPWLYAMYLPLAAWLLHRKACEGRTIVLGVCGGQGSGKSTFCELLNIVLSEGFAAAVAAFSIDDIYKTREGRLALARDTHPLFATRGVPGTHDVELGIETIRRLTQQGAGEHTRVPVFDKASDTRRSESEWPSYAGEIDIVVLEGWCVGAAPQSEEQLREPVNALERDEDPDATWRSTVNDALKGPYEALFGLIDVQILLQVDGMDRVFEWRQLQEHKLAERLRDSNADMGELHVMSDAEVERFIMHYERLTRHILTEMPARADIVFRIDETHNAARVAFNPHP